MANRRGILVGGGAFGRELLSWSEDSSSSLGETLDFIGFLDKDRAALSGFEDLKLTWMGDPRSYTPVTGDVFLMAVGDPTTKEELFDALAELGGEFATVVHPTAVIARTAKLGRGVVVGPQSYIATHSVLHDGVCINSLTGIGHDAVVGAHTTISSQVDVTGRVSVGTRVFVGSGARILPNVTIGEDAKIGAGAVVVRNVKPSSTVFAQPARIM